MIKFLLFTIVLCIVNAISDPDPAHLCQEIMTEDCTVSYIPGEKDETVCGTDGVTYRNMCFFSQSRCNNKRIQMKHLGDCVITTTHPTTTGNFSFLFKDLKKRDSTRVNIVSASQLCQNLLSLDCMAYNHEGGRDETTCGTDNVTYRNYCYYSQARCKDDTLDLKAMGNCTFATTPPTTAVTSTTVDPFLQVFCAQKDSITCRLDDTSSPICGSNGRLYRNKCFFNMAKCDNLALTSGSLQVCVDAFVGK
ncbi:serine protease inhibitor dipetalogastin-like [Ruditapes philippinarum]|uniref:serine protease inhibitor dipetalogastin-like n=1 Tax=Ruditapes philippinarum TaxID=129788 RepID=UPI00295AB7F7|nr:serine protease inhibitor dipetalogastin-like [Ruditapes philippinarum]